MQILVTNDDGWDAPGLAALKALAERLGEVYVVAPREPHSGTGHRVTTDSPLVLAETAPRDFTLTGTPADCVRVAISTLFPQIDCVLAGINRGGNLGADIFMSGTVAAAREAALLGRPGIAISQYLRKGPLLDWQRSGELALPVIQELVAAPRIGRGYWNVNLPHLDSNAETHVIRCDPDTQPLEVRFRQEGTAFHYAGSYQSRARTPGRDVENCFAGSITVSWVPLG